MARSYTPTAMYRYGAMQKAGGAGSISGDPRADASTGELLAFEGYTEPSTLVTGDAGVDRWSGNTPNIIVDDANACTRSFNVASGDDNGIDILKLAKKIPDGLTIDGIQIEIRRYAPVGTVVDTTVQLIIAGSLAGDNNADAITAWSNVGTETILYGNATEKWGLTPTFTQLNADDFGMTFQANFTAGGSLGSCDFIGMRVWFS